MAMASPSLWLYRLLVAILLPVAIPVLNIRDWFRGKRRPSFRDRMSRKLPAIPAGGLWLHAVSVGEVELARRLVRELAERAPDLPLLITATTATGLELARRALGANHSVIVCPLDLPGPVSRVLEAARPRALVVVETEIWPEMLHQASRRGVATAVVNGRLSDASYRGYRRVRRLLAPFLRSLDLVAARAQADADRFAALGAPVDRVRVVGNIKYDLEPDETPLPWADSLRCAAGARPIIVAGSTMEGEEEAVLAAVARCAAGGRPVLLVLAPRHPERFDAVAELVATRGLRLTRRSASQSPDPGTEVFLIDTIGELARAYQLATVAFIGGSLVPTGGHNPLEPAVWGVPVLSGPHVHNFVEVYDEMTTAGGARLVADGAALSTALVEWLDAPDAARASGAAGREVVEANRGATAVTAKALLGLVAGASSS